jgi:hypothetical protein
MSLHNVGNDFGVSVDVWGAFAASEWASSLAFTMKCNSNGVGGQMVGVGAGILIGSTVYDSIFGDLGRIVGTVNGANSCPLTPINTWTLTVYDDGSFAGS